MNTETTANFTTDLLRRLEQLNTIGSALSREHDTNRLLENILLAAKDITNADGGTLYRVTDDERALRFEIMRTDSLNIAMGGTTGKKIELPLVQLFDADGQPNDRAVAAYAANHERTVNISDAYDNTKFDFTGTRAFDQRMGYRSQSMLAVPMKNHEDRVIGVLQLLNARKPGSGEVTAFLPADQSLVESLASQAAIALTNRQLIKQLEELFESLISMINEAIDEKSEYTGGHCQRVPELTMLLADAAAATKEGPLAGFSMTEKDRYELKIAGLLHDCGKITTPVHVVDKATKLETIYDRIGLVDTRFEVLKRDAEIAALRAKLALRPVVDAEAEAAVDVKLAEQLARYDADRDFLRRSNKGGEAMRDEDIQRVRDMATQYRWRAPGDAEGQTSDFLSPNEVENLTIARGTLTHPEREIINHHIVATINMLEQLPWPRHLRNVPEYAGGHHERMDGKGYPKGLTREQMSVQARVMGIADIFEALTASDRPYKPPMKLSQALSIMANMKKGGHIDPDLFEIFVRERVYLRYAERFLAPDQIDEVNQEAVLA
jgi:HD-GYP domain-containing protein (c-di-GMP phosphodiesterase class II)